MHLTPSNVISSGFRVVGMRTSAWSLRRFLVARLVISGF